MASSGEDELQNLRPMLVHTDDASNQPSTSSGTGAQRQWFVQMEEGLEDDEDMGESRDPAYERALESYMRGEITYEEFVQTTGVTVDDDDDDDDGEGEEDEDEYVEVDDPSETPSSKKRRLRAEYLTGETAQLLASFKHDSDTMEYVGVEEGEGEDTMDDYEDDTDYQPGASSSPRKRRSQHLQGVASPRILQPTPALAHHRPGDEHRDEEKLLGIPDELRGKSLPKVQRRLPKPLEALLGQANVMHAKGSTQEAIDMLSEVIRQEPRNSESYKVLADIYNDMGDQDKALEYGLLSAHLDYKTPASEWARLGHLCEESDKWDQAAIVYGRAIRAEPANWQYYESRIRMLDVMELTSLAMKTRLAAVQNITNPADFAWLEQLVNSVVEYYTANSDEEKAANALESLLVRAKRRGIFLYGHLDRLVGMWMRLGGRYKEAAQAVFIHAAGDLDALDAVGEPAVLVVSNPTGPGYTVADPFPPDTVHEYRVSDRLPTSLLARVIVCFIRLSRWDLAEPLLTEMNKRESSSTCEESYLEVARAFQATNALELAQKFGENLLGQDVFADSPAVWLAYADILHDRRKLQPAVDAFKRVVELAPTHVDARIKLSTLQQELGMPDQALDTLRDYDLDECTELPDERLLQRQADMLFTRKLHDQFARCARMLVTPYFFEIHRLALDRVRRERSIAGNVSMLLRTAAMDALRGSPLERFVKRMGPGAVDRQRVLNADQLHDYCLKLVEVLFSKQLYSEMLSVCCYAYMQPMLTSSGRTRTFDGLLLLAAIKAQAWNVAFEYLRGVQAPLENRSNRLWNAFNAVFVNFQDMRYHRYIMRALYKEPGNLALTTLSGNNSLISGSYRHALGEYLRVWQKLPDDPLICLLLGLTFVHMASKKDVSKRHQVALRGVAFLNKYERARGVKQEVWYNLGRAFHQLNILYAAVHFYKKVFDSEAPPVVRYDEETGEMKREIAEEYDLKPLAAHNLALIYQTSGNRHLARQVLEKYCIV